MDKVRRRFSTGSFWLVSPASPGNAKDFPVQPSHGRIPEPNDEKPKYMPGNDESNGSKTVNFRALHLGAAAIAALGKRTSGLSLSFRVNPLTKLPVQAGASPSLCLGRFMEGAMKKIIPYLLLSFLIGTFMGIGSHALAQKAVPLSEQEKAIVNQGSSTATATTSGTVKALPAKKAVKKKPAAATATSVAPTLSTGIKKTTAVPASPSYTPPTVKSVKQPAATTATGVAPKPSTGIKKTATFPVSPSYTPPVASAPQISGKPPVQSGGITITPNSGYVAPSFTSTPSAVGSTGISGQGPGVKSTGASVTPSYTPPSLSLPSNTVGVGTAVQGQGQGIQTPSGSYVTPMYDPPRSGPFGSGASAGQPGSATTAPRGVPLFPASAGTGTGGQEQGAKAAGSFLTPSPAGGKGTTPGSDASPSFSGSSAPPVVDNIERMRMLREKYGKTGTTLSNVQADGTGSKIVEGTGAASGETASKQTAEGGGTVPTAKTGKTAAAVSLEAAAAASAASGIVGAEAKKESSGQLQSSDTTGAGQQGETAADREKEVRERFKIPDDVPIKSTAEALGFAKQIELLGGKLTPETRRTWNEKGNEAVIKGTLCENYEIPDCAAVGSSKDIWDILRASATVGDGRVTPEIWRDVRKRGKDAVIDGMIEDTFGVTRPGNMSREDLLKGLAEGDRLGVPRQELPSFVQDWDRQRNGGITLDELLNKWMPGARAGIDRGGIPGDGLPGGPGSGSSGLPGVPTGPGGGIGGTGPGGAPRGVPGGGSGQTGNLVDVMRTGFGIGAAAGGGSGGTGIPGAPGSGGSGTGIGAAGQSGGVQGQGTGGDTGTTPGGGSGGTGSGSGGAGEGSGSGNTSGAGTTGASDNTSSGTSTEPSYTVTHTSDGGFDVTSTDNQGTITVHFTPNGDGTYSGTAQNGTPINVNGKMEEGNYAYTPDETGNQGSSTTSSGSTGSTTSSSGSTASTGGTQGTGEEGQSGMYNPDDDSLYRRRGMSAEERAKAMEEFQKLKPVDGGRGGEGGVRVTGRKMSDVDPAQAMRNRITPYTDPNPDADQSQHSGPIPVGDERGNLEQPVPDGGPTAPGFGRMGDATRPGGGQTGPGGGFDPHAAGEQQE